MAFPPDGDQVVSSSDPKTESVASVVRGNGDGTFESQEEIWTDLEPAAIVTADLNLDGKPDLAMSNVNQAFTITVLLNGVPPPPPPASGEWIQISTGGAPPRYLGSGAYDPVSNRLIAFGGQAVSAWVIAPPPMTFGC